MIECPEVFYLIFVTMNQFDSLQTFLFKETPIRGQIVRLQASYLTALSTGNYPPIIQRLLGESLCAAALLSSIIKFKGRISIQAQGNGALALLFAQSDEERHIRGLAHFTPTLLETPNTLTLKELLGEGLLVITLDPHKGDRYQGLVSLTGNNLAQCLQDYFHQSEQISTFLIFMVDEDIASGMILQRLPVPTTVLSQESSTSWLTWEECVHLASTITAKELCHLNNENILHRLFPTYDIELFDEKPVSYRCSCSRERIGNALVQMGEEEILALLKEQNGLIKTHCEFCNREYRFDAVDITSIFKEIVSPSPHREQ